MVTATPISTDQVSMLLSEVRALRHDMKQLVDRQRAQQELIDELTPILKSMMALGGEKLGELEAKGYFAFGRELLGVLDKVVTGFSAQDVEQLGDNVVQILGTVRQVTQPAVLAIADEATHALEVADDSEPMSWRGLWKASHDADVQRGVAALLAVLRKVGRLAEENSSERRGTKQKLEKLLGPSRPAPKPPRRAPPVAQATVAAKPAKVVLSIPGLALDKDGFLADAAAWNREVAERIARAVGVAELSEVHWKVLDYARAEFQENRKSPNVRRLSTGTGLSVKELYALFPNTPGMSVSRIAGIPKPAGCI